MAWRCRRLSLMPHSDSLVASLGIPPPEEGCTLRVQWKDGTYRLPLMPVSLRRAAFQTTGRSCQSGTSRTPSPSTTSTIPTVGLSE